MKAKIMTSMNYRDNLFVNFETEIGSGIACWKSRDKPVCDLLYDVELDIGKNFSALSNKVNSGEHLFFIKNDGHFVYINGIVDSIDDDGLVFLRLALNGLVMMDDIEAVLSVGDWVNIKIFPSDLHIYASGVSN